MTAAVSVACLMCIVLFSTCLAQRCTKTGTCSCQNTQGTLDLSPLAYGDGTPRFRDVPGLNGWRYSYNPCVGFSEGSGPCELVALCQSNGSMSFSLGAANSTVYQNSSSGWQLVYTSMGMPQRVSTITLVCDPSVVGNFTVQGEMPLGSNKYFFTLRSKNACFIPMSTSPMTSTMKMPTTPSAAAASVPGLLCVTFLFLVGVSLRSWGH
ncbi:uncharacterized protein [Haliotis asinina]|uniref:uncharacterized protein n=1 Tax=Haliotis asinina TaxID=109174 RepID=UPI0035322C1B